MPREYIIREKQMKINILFLALGSIILLLIVIGVIIPYKIINDKTKVLTELNEQISDSKYEVNSEVKQQLSQKQEEIRLLQDLLNEMEKETIVSRITLDLLIGFLPPNMYIQKLALDNEEKSIIIEGNAEKAESVSEYVVQLSNLPFVEKVDMKTTTEEVKFDEENSVLEDIVVVKYELTLQMEKEEGELNKDETQSE